MIDLHMHTKYSDGTDSVKEILIKAEELGLEVISITDHNSCDAYDELESLEIDKYYHGNIIIGCEFYTSFNNRIIEVLGYGFELETVKKFLNEFYSPELTKKRYNEKYINILNKLDEFGFKYNKNAFDQKTIDSGYIEIPIQKELIKYPENFNKIDEDVISSINDFYRNGLTNPKSKLYIDYASSKPSLKKIFEVIHNAGGKIFLAHLYEYGFENPEQFLKDICNEVDFDGIECFHSSFTKEQTNYLTEFCKNNNLLISGGTDYHGTAKEGISMGSGRNNIAISKSIIENWNIGYYKKEVNN